MAFKESRHYEARDENLRIYISILGIRRVCCLLSGMRFMEVYVCVFLVPGVEWTHLFITQLDTDQTPQKELQF
jgi:hypothetical protein